MPIAFVSGRAVFRQSLRGPPLYAIAFKNSKELAEYLIRSRQLRREHVLEMTHLDPKWMVAFYIRAVALSAALGLRAPRQG
jgi:hypothetical protein